jgi:asparagine synthase (glutamine-hydrolysing)
MLCSLEARAPFLERSLVEAAASMPSTWKVRGFATKVVLRKALASVLPEETLRRRKRGFALPVSRGFEGPLGDRLRERLATASLFRDVLDPALPAAVLEEHRRGERYHGRRLYALLALVEWTERYAARPGPAREAPASRPSPAARASAT